MGWCSGQGVDAAMVWREEKGDREEVGSSHVGSRVARGRRVSKRCGLWRRSWSERSVL
jgi:hypothetical protein